MLSTKSLVYEVEGSLASFTTIIEFDTSPWYLQISLLKDHGSWTDSYIDETCLSEC